MLAERFGLPTLVATILAARGLDHPDRAAAFLDPRLNAVSDPFLIPDMDRAVCRLATALRQKESMAVFGDYDVDGVVSTALLTQTLRQLGGRVNPFLPNRMQEGYGFTPAALTRCLAQVRPSLIVTADCGTGATETVALARQAGCDVIVTDHHAPAPPIADASADINPKRSAREDIHALAGVGVAFKVCHALVKHGLRHGFPQSSNMDLRDWLDFVALGSVADMVPLTGENRTWVRYGLNQLNRTRHIGLRALIDTAKLTPPLSPSDIGFGLGPRLNAVGRLGSADVALALLMTEDAAEADRLASLLDKANRQRRTIETRIQQETLAMLENSFDAANDFGLALAGDDWEPGVIGIVASRVCRQRFRPTAIASFRDGDNGRGSCRSIEGVNVLNILEQCAPFLDAYGGHCLAAGFSIGRAAWPEFKHAFNNACREQLNGQVPTPALSVDAWIDDLQDVTPTLHRQLQRLAPFGQGNPAPILGFKALTLDGPPRVLGGRHLKFRVRHDGTAMNAIAFGMGDRAIPESPVELAADLVENTYRGETTLQLVVKDFRPAG